MSGFIIFKVQKEQASRDMTDFNTENAVLNAQIQTLEFSDDFKNKSRLMGFVTLQEIIETKPEHLVEIKGFNYSWLGELIAFLTDCKLLHKLQSAPGNPQ